MAISGADEGLVTFTLEVVGEAAVDGVRAVGVGPGCTGTGRTRPERAGPHGSEAAQTIVNATTWRGARRAPPTIRSGQAGGDPVE